MLGILSSSITDKCDPPTRSFELHAACAAWPEMSPPELRDLSDDIFVNGLREPISLAPNGQLLDGRNRALACQMAGVEPTTMVYDGDPWLFSLSKNKHRRHLTTDQIAIVAAKLATRGEGGDGSNQHKGATGSAEPVAPALSNAQVAEASGVPETAIKSAKVVLRHGTSEEKKRVESGAAPLRKTADRIRSRMRSPEVVKKTPAAPHDPIEDVACDLIGKVGDGAWRALPEMAAAVDVATSVARDGLKRLGADVETRRGADGLEYRIKTDDGGNGRDAEITAKDAEIANLKTQLAARDAEIARLKAKLLAATAKPPQPAKKANEVETRPQ
jgi:hypothetical protein